MTAADVIQLRSIELPMLASDPRVRVVEDMTWELDSCEQCIQRAYAENQADDEIPVGKFRVTWKFNPGRPEHHTDVCGEDCADVELDDLLTNISAVEVTLHIPAASKFLPSGPLLSPARPLPCSAVDPDGDRLCQQLLSLREGIAGMRNDGTGDIGRSGFESARVEVLTLINNQIESLGRVA